MSASQVEILAGLAVLHTILVATRGLLVTCEPHMLGEYTRDRLEGAGICSFLSFSCVFLRMSDLC